MADSAEKTLRPSVTQHVARKSSFFGKGGDEPSFFSAGAQGKSSFFGTGGTSIQAKLSVSKPDDPQEKEADSVAEKVMTMPAPSVATTAGGVQEEEVKRKENEEEKVQAKPIQVMLMGAPEKKEEEPVQRMEQEKEVQRMEQKEEESPVHRMEQKEEEPVQRMEQKEEEAPVHRMGEKEEEVQRSWMGVHRAEDKKEEQVQAKCEACAGEEKEEKVQRKKISLHRSDVIQRSGRGPPRSSIPFEQSLTSSKGMGSPMPADTRSFMESRFNADFSGVRIHTSSQAETMNRQVHAQAFTHGNDIYFNSGKYSPGTASGNSLLAHELTHTIQQGASKHVSTPASSSAGAATVATKPIVARKNMIHRSVEGAAVPQLGKAVELAKTKEGLVNANKEGGDGYREGWQHLLEFFKTTFGEEQIVSGSGGGQKGSVAEADIKKKRTVDGMLIVDPVNTNGTTYGSRDAMPSWCGIFVLWALNKSGVPMPKWKLGENVIKPEAAHPPGYTPRPGDIAYRNAYSHYAMVEKVTGSTVTTINGNTAGEDNMGGQVQSRDHPLSDWTGFFNPMALKTGDLGAGEGGDERTRSLEEMRKKLFGVSAKSEHESAPHEAMEDERQENEQVDTKRIQPKPEMGSLSVNRKGELQPAAVPSAGKAEEKELQKKEEKDQEEDASPKAIQQKEVHRKAEGRSLSLYSSNAQTNSSGHAVVQPSRQDTGSSSLTGAGSVHAQGITTAARGPPSAAGQSAAVQLRAQGIQRSWLGDAWDAVSGIASEAAAFVERGLDAAKEWLLGQVRDFVSNIPGYSLLSLILSRDPITGQRVERNGTNLLNAGLDLLPAGHMFRALMQRLGIFNDVAIWLDGRIDDLSTMASSIGSRFLTFWEGLSLDDVGDPEGVMNRVAELLRSTIDDIVGFVTRSATEFLEMVKRVIIREVAAFVRNRIPRLYPLLTVALGFDPENFQPVARNGINILNALLEVSEEGREQRKQMTETGTLQRIAAWIDRGIAVFSSAYDQLISAFQNIWRYVTIENLFSPVETFTRIWDEFSRPVTMVGQFLLDAAIEILKVIKEALMRRLKAFAMGTRGYHLVTVIIGRDPFTNEVVPRTVHNVVRGFMSLMEGGEEQYNQLRESGAIDQAVARVMAAVARLNMTPAAILQLFIDLWNSFSIRDLADPIGAFRRIVATFGEPIGRLFRFIVEIIKIVVEVILRVMNFPIDLINNIIAKAMLAFDLIKANPVGFLKNLLKAIKQGFIQFFDNIATHLLNGLTGWLMSELRDANVPAPTDFTLRGIIGWVLEVLGLSMEKIWEKLAAHPRIGPERVARIRGMINTLEGIWTFIKDVQERGIAAIWDKIMEQLTNLWDTVLDAIKNWIMERIVNQVVTKLLSMLDPTGIMAVINSAIAIYRAIQSFMRYLREMLEVVNSFVEGTVEIAQGNTKRAADFLERTMGRAMPIVIGFLANQVGLSGIGRRVAEMIGRAREMVDQALTWLVNKAVDLGGRLLDMGRSAASTVASGVRSLLGLEEHYTNEAGENHTVLIEQNQTQLRVKRASVTPEHISVFLTNKLNDLNTAGSPLATLPDERKAEMRTAITTAQGIITRIEAISYPATPPTQATAHIQQQMNTELAALKRQVQLIDKGAAPVPPVSVVPGFSSNLASSLEVKYLMMGHHPAGTPASAYGGDMHGGTPILENIGLYPGKWVNFHLLNHNYGGLAVDSNLVPTPTGINNNYKDTFEESFKGKYNPAAPATPKVMWFRTNVRYRDGTVFAQTITSNGGGMKASGRDWIPDPAEVIPTWTETIPPPVAESVAINRLPATQALQRAMARYTPLTADLLVLLARLKPRVVTSSDTLISLLDSYARSGALTPAEHTRYTAQINATTFDFSR